MAKYVTTNLRTYTLTEVDGKEVKTLQTDFTKAKKKEVSDQLLFRQKLSFINQCKDLSLNEPGADEMEIEMVVNDKPFYKAQFRKGEMVHEEAFPLTVVK